MTHPAAFAAPVPYPPAAESPPRPPRPATVRAAFILLLAIVVIMLAVIAATAAEAIHFNAVIDRVAARTGADSAEVTFERSSNLVPAVVVAVLCLLLASWLAAAAFPLRRGSNVARILVFVASGLQLLACLGPCGGVLLIPLMFAMEPMPPMDPAEDPAFSESEFVTQLYNEADPGMEIFFGVLSVATMLVFALSVAVVVLLLVPASNRFFVPRHPVPAMFVPYPAHPYPAHPYAWYPGYWPVPPAHWGPPPSPWTTAAPWTTTAAPEQQQPAPADLDRPAEAGQSAQPASPAESSPTPLAETSPTTPAESPPTPPAEGGPSADASPPGPAQNS